MLIACGGTTTPRADQLIDGGNDAALPDGATGSQCVSGAPIILASGQNYPERIALDANYVYFSNRGSDLQPDGSIVRVPKVGGAPEVLVPGIVNPTALIVDADTIYFDARGLGQGAFGTFDSVPKTGGTPVGLTADDAWAFALDGESLFYAMQSAIAMRQLPGGNVVTLASDNDSPSGLAIDKNNVYVAMFGGSIVWLPRTGGSLTTLATDQNQPTGVAVDDAYVYWTNQSNPVGGSVARAPKSGGAVTTLAQNQDNPQSLVVDDTYVYWVNLGPGLSYTQGSVMKAPKTGGTPTTISSPEAGPSMIVQDATSIYWVTRGNYKKSDGTVSKACK